MVLLHKHGGKITAIHGCGHSTYKGVAEWWFFGDVEWDDGSGPSTNIEIPPFALYTDDEASRSEVFRLHDLMTGYLGTRGRWLEKAKSKKDGRLVHWEPRQPKDRVWFDQKS